MLIQKSINAAAQTLESSEDIQVVRELHNKYVLKQVIERYIRNQMIEGIKNPALFDLSVETYIDIQAGEVSDVSSSQKNGAQAVSGITCIEVFIEEYKKKLIELNEVQKKSYIEWKVQKRANETIYQSDEVKIDGMRWKFIAEMESSEIFKVYVKQLSQG